MYGKSWLEIHYESGLFVHVLIEVVMGLRNWDVLIIEYRLPRD